MCSNKNLYFFVADVHLGLGYKEPAERERQFAEFLNTLPHNTKEVYLLGDIFDFWYEYKDVVPSGYTRALGAMAALVDRGIKLHFFNGNHDIWTYRYLQNEIGAIVHPKPEIVQIEGERFFLAHGDGLWDKCRSYRILQKIFKCRFLQALFSCLHPRWALWLGKKWSRHNRIARYSKENDHAREKFCAEQTAKATAWAEEYLNNLQATGKQAVNHFILGHYHISASSRLKEGATLSILGDWLNNTDYLLFDGHQLTRHKILRCAQNDRVSRNAE